MHLTTALLMNGVLVFAGATAGEERTQLDRLKALERRVTALEDTTAAAVQGLKRRLRTLEERVTDDAAARNALETRVAASETQVLELEERVTALEQTTRSPAMYDATGAVVGSIIDLMSANESGSGERGESVTVVFHVAPHVFHLQAVPLGFTADQGNVVAFDSPDCTGTAFISLSDPPRTGRFFSPAAMSPYYLGIVYAAAPDAVPHTVQIRSHLHHSGLGAESYVNGEGTGNGLTPAVPVIDLRTRFTPPFTIR